MRGVLYFDSLRLAGNHNHACSLAGQLPMISESSPAASICLYVY
jgi:hypothetical protein